MDIKKRILGGAILTALAGTSAYFCSNNDTTQINYERNLIEKQNTNEESELNLSRIIPSPYLGEKTLETEIKKEETAKPVKSETLDERISRLSNLFEDNYKRSTTIYRDFESDKSEGKINTYDGKSWYYKLSDGNLLIIFDSENLGAEFKYIDRNGNVDLRRVNIFERGRDLLIIKTEKDSNFTKAYTRGGTSSEVTNSKEMENAKDIHGIMIWKGLIPDILRMHR